MDELARIVIIGALVEAVVETVEWLLDREFLRPRLLALAGSMLLAITFGLNIFTLLGIVPPPGTPLEAIAPWVGTILTGLLLSRGANFVHDLIERLRGNPPPAPASR